MTGIEFFICTSSLLSVVTDQAGKRSLEYRQAIAHNICAAANAAAFDPITLAALIMGENQRFDVNITMPASAGADQGLCQLNSVHQRERLAGKNPYHPYDCTRVAAQILKFYEVRYKDSWMVIASYWNPLQAKQQTQAARRYFDRWASNYRYIQTHFIQTRNGLPTALGSP